MASSSSVLSGTLQSITVTKIKELEKQKDSYNAHKDSVFQQANDNSGDVRGRIHVLLKGVKDVRDSTGNETKTRSVNINRWTTQSLYDTSVPESKLLAFEQKLRSHLEQGCTKLDLAHLYSRLLTEWIGSSTSAEAESEDLEGSGSDESFEVVQDTAKARLEQLRDKFARVVFGPLETDEAKIESYLSKLFEGDHGARALERLRDEVSGFGERALGESFRLDDQHLRWCIKALLKNDLLNDEKKASLNDFLKDEAVLAEIRDVLNMRFRDLKDWSWNLGDEGMPVVPRQSLNGKWRVMMDEDVLEALLTHWIGTCWAVCMKRVLTNTRYSARLWKQYTRIPDDEKAKREYYFNEWSYGRMTGPNSVAQERQNIYNNDFFMAPLPSKEFEEAGGYDDDEDTPSSDAKSPKDIKQLLLRTLATEIIMRRSLDGEVAVVQSDFQWFATGIAHTTVIAVMRFMGFQEEWITFFKKVLEPPLNMLDGNPVRTRKRGLPMAHVFEKLLGELVLFFMDLAVAHHDGMILYRFHDDLWLAGSPSACSAAWKTMEEFAQVMGLEFNKNKTGSVYLTDGKRVKNSNVAKALPEGPVAMNFLVLDPKYGNWVIDKDHVQEHVVQLQKQLTGSKSVLQWIKTWNSCIGRFFSYTFGEPAHCFGKEHLNNILRTHRDMQNFLFNSTETGVSVTEHIKHMLSKNFDMNDVVDSFLFMPESLGGLGLKNPFIPLLLLRHDVCDDPEARMAKFHDDELKEYNQAKKYFESMSERERRRKYKDAFEEEDDDEIEPSLSWKDAQTFMSFDEFTKYRERTSSDLHRLYTYFLKQPKEVGVAKSDRVKNGLTSLKYPLESGEMDAEMLWKVQFFEDELFDKFGGLEVVDKGLLPLGVLKALKARKVTWQMVL